jgi:hypothetical protein
MINSYRAGLRQIWAMGELGWAGRSMTAGGGVADTTQVIF